jgi:hypothetical protein
MARRVEAEHMRLAARAAIAAGIVTTLALAPAAEARPNANVAALQVALRALHHYHGHTDGIMGPRTRRAVRRFQKRRGLRVDGVPGRRTRRALGRRGRPRVGSRVMRRGHRGWDIAALQFMLKRRGFSPRSIDGGFGPRTGRKVRRFQRAVGIRADGRAGPATIRALKHRKRKRRRGHGGGAPRGPVRFFRPVNGPLTSGFGMRWGRMHHGVDFAAPTGTAIGAGGVGVVTFAGWNAGGYGYLVVVQHRLGFSTWYAHMLRVTSHRGERVVGGTRLGLVGCSGHCTGPHVHFEVRRYGRPINPMPYLLSRRGKQLARPGAPPPADRGCANHRSAPPEDPARSEDSRERPGPGAREPDPATEPLGC